MRENRSLDEFLEPSTDRSAPRTDETSGADDDSVAQRDGDEEPLEEDGNSEPSEVEEDGDSEPSESAGDDATDEAVSATDTTLEPMQPTLRWSPDGETCSACNERAGRLWRDDDGLVCPDCKSW